VSAKRSRTAHDIHPGGRAPVVSVVVPVRDGGSGLAELAEALAAQTLARDRFEVLVADDGSSDGATKGLATEDEWLRVLPGPPINSYAARNRAARSAAAPVLAFCDADCRPEPPWLERGLVALEQADVVGGLIVPLLPERPTVWTLLDLDFHVDQERAVASGRGLGGNLFVRREVFERVGGFDESIPNTGDSDLVSRCISSGARLAFAPDAVVSHPTHNRPWPFLRKVWRIQRALGVREARRGVRPRLLTASSVPILSMIRSRRSARRPLLLDRTRLAANGVEPRLRDHLRALPLMYLLLPVLTRAARFRGWWIARRLR
jgi:glycosyltransferase involved in cell wall biosynthesis